MLIFGTHEAATQQQLQTCVDAAEGALGVLCADGHVGYSMPIGGVVAYRDHISPSGVGYDIGCGNLAVQTTIRMQDIPAAERERLADEIFARISFGVGRNNDEPVDDPVFDAIAAADVPEQRGLLSLARNQLGTVGSGNHYVDVLEDELGFVWIACHFGSRGFGHKTATMFMNVAKGIPITEKASDGEMMSPPLLLDAAQSSGQAYIAAMQLAGQYAYAGRRHVVDKVLSIFGNPAITMSVHNHHNFAWRESHQNNAYWVVRKGATPARIGQRGFIGGSMQDISVIVAGRESPVSEAALYSTVHGAGRVMSRNAAIKGKHEWRCVDPADPACSYRPSMLALPRNMKCPVHQMALAKVQLTQPIDFRAVQTSLVEAGVVLRGAGADEAPAVYRPLRDVLTAHKETIDILVEMRPRIVCMAPKKTFDPYKD